MTAATSPANPWDELAWLLSVLEDWLLIAEPATVKELSAFLQSIGSNARAADVIELLARVRQMTNGEAPQ